MRFPGGGEWAWAIVVAAMKKAAEAAFLVGLAGAH
jgi:hypothetical protein